MRPSRATCVSLSFVPPFKTAPPFRAGIIGPQTAVLKIANKSATSKPRPPTLEPETEDKDADSRREDGAEALREQGTLDSKWGDCLEEEERRA